MRVVLHSLSEGLMRIRHNSNSAQSIVQRSNKQCIRNTTKLRCSKSQQCDLMSRREVLLKGISPLSLYLSFCGSRGNKRCQLYDKYFSYAMSHFTAEYEEWVEPYKMTLFASLASVDPIDLLEIGVGTGVNFNYYKSQAPNAKIIGLDPNPEMSIYAEEAASKAKLRDFRFVNGYGESLPFKDNSFDFVVATLVMCSVDNVSEALSEIHRVLKPKGQYLFLEHVVGAKGSLTRFTQQAFNPIQKLMADNCHLTRDTLASIRSSDFQQVDAQAINIEQASFLAPHIVGHAVV